MIDLTTVLAFLGLLLGAGGIGTVLVQTWGKRVRTPADRQAEVELGVRILQDQIAKADRDAARWLQVETFLREQLTKADQDRERLESLLVSSRAQIADLTTERDELRQRLHNLAAKYRAGVAISLRDILGDQMPDVQVLAADIEDTQNVPPHPRRRR